MTDTSRAAPETPDELTDTAPSDPPPAASSTEVLVIPPAHGGPALGPVAVLVNDEGLSDLEERFIDALLSNGGRKQAAAETAGYAKGPGAAVAANRVLKRPRVQEAIMRRVRSGLVEASVASLGTLTRLASKARSEYVQLEAAKAVLTQAGVIGGKATLRATFEIDLGG